MVAGKLTVIQKRTKDALMNKDYKNLKSGNISTLLKKELALDRNTFESLLKSAVGFYKATTGLKDSQIFKKLTASYNASQLSEAKDAIKEAESKGLFSGFGGEQEKGAGEGKHDDAPGGKPRETPINQPVIPYVPYAKRVDPQPQPEPSVGGDEPKASTRFTDLPFAKNVQDIKRRVADVSGVAGKIIGSNLKEGALGLLQAPGDAFSLGNKVYSENKQAIDGILSKLNKESAEDGTLLTGLASLAYPEIALLQGAVDAVGLGFDEEDTELLDRMLSEDPMKSMNIPVGKAATTWLKAIANPVQGAKILQTAVKRAGTQFADTVSDVWGKVTGKKPDLPERPNLAPTALLTDKERETQMEEFQGALQKGRSSAVSEAINRNDKALVGRLLDGMKSEFKWGDLSENDINAGIQRLKNDKENLSELIKVARKWVPSNPSNIKSFKEFITKLPEQARGLFSSEVAGVVTDNLKRLDIDTGKPVQSIAYKPQDQGGEIVPATQQSKDVFAGATKLYQPFLDGLDRLIQGRRTFDGKVASKEDVDRALSIRDRIMAITEGGSALSDKSRALVDFMSGLGEGIGGFVVPSGGKELLTSIKDKISTAVGGLAGESKPPQGGAVKLSGQGGSPVETLSGVSTASGIGDQPVDPREAQAINEQQIKDEEALLASDGPQGRAMPSIKETKIDVSDRQVPKLRPRFPAGDTDAEVQRDPEEVARTTRILESALQEQPGYSNGQDNSLFQRAKWLDELQYKNASTIPSPVKPDMSVSAKTEMKMESEWIEMAPAGAEQSAEHDMVSAFAYTVFNDFTPNTIQTVYPRQEMINSKNEYPDLALRRNHGDELDIADQVKEYKNDVENIQMNMRWRTNA